MIEFSIYTIFTLYTAYAASFLEGDWFQIVVLLYLSVLFALKKLRVDNEIIIFFFVWCSINGLALLLNRGDDFKLISFLSVSARMLFPYLMLKIVGRDFFKGLFDYWFILCLMGLPFYIIELVTPDFVQSLAPKLNFITQQEQTERGGFYLFFYMHNYYASSFYTSIARNSGFLWEPGAYAVVLVFMIVYNNIANEYKINWKTIVLTVCLLTTLSTSGYLALFFIFVISLYQNNNIFLRYKAILPVVVIIVGIAATVFYFSADFMSNKIDRYIEQGTKSYQWSFGDNKAVRVSRIGIAIIALENAVRDPWGNGIVTSDYVIDQYHNAVGPNSLATILFHWGWIGLVGLFYSLYNFRVEKIKCRFLLMLPLAIPLFSNPFAFRTLIYAIVYSVLCIPEMKYETEDEDYC